MSLNVSRRSFLAGGIGLLAGVFGAKLLPHEELSVFAPELPAGTFVFRPYARTAGGVFGSWAELGAAVAAQPGLKTIFVDSTFSV